MMDKKSRVLRNAAASFIFVLIAGCLPPHVQPVHKVVLRPPLFPPQAVMQTGDYKGFLAKNSQALTSCGTPDKCAEALFNLSFLYCYPKSPYYDPEKGLQYITDLIVGAPKSPWAAQAMVWKELIVKEMKESRERLITREKLRSKEASESEDQAAQEKDWQVDRLLLEDEIKSKDEIIKELTKQIKGSRQIDIKMEEKERGLLH